LIAARNDLMAVIYLAAAVVGLLFAAMACLSNPDE